MAPRRTPGKPFVTCRNGHWHVFVPQVVFGDEASGTCHGPFGSWEIARQASVGIASAVLFNVRMFNSGAIQIGMVN